MPSYHSRFSQVLILLGDLVFLNVAFSLALILRFAEVDLASTEYYNYYLQLWVITNLLWFLLSFAFKTYNSAFNTEPRKALSKTIKVWTGHLFLLLLLLVILQKSEAYSRLFILYFYAALSIAIFPWHFFFRRFLQGLRNRNKSLRQVVLAGNLPSLFAFADSVQKRPDLGIEISAIYNDDWHSKGMAFPEDQLEQDLGKHQGDELFVAYDLRDDRFRKLYYLAEQKLLRFRALPDLGLPPAKALEISFYDDSPVLSFQKEPLEYWHNRLIKRLEDILLSILLILIFYPIFWPILTIGVLLSGKGSLLFTQWRSGYRGADFKIYKFRSMVPNKEAHLKQAETDDSRITGFGTFIRSWHLDEIPQFWQVLIGEMSLVGPRPHMLAHTEQYRHLVDRYMLRHFVKPGLSGLAQVQGLKGDHDLEAMKERVKADVYYLENWSLLLDISILVRTLWQIISAPFKNADQ
jgi:putative colanic acid biosynthesis UDP-glucose lipid carrier transferase